MSSPLDTTADDFVKYFSDELHLWGHKRGAGFAPPVAQADLPKGVTRFEVKHHDPQPPSTDPQWGALDGSVPPEWADEDAVDSWRHMYEGAMSGQRPDKEWDEWRGAFKDING